MEHIKNLTTKKGKKIYSNEFIQKLRVEEDKKKDSRTYIAQEGAQEDDLHSSVDILITGGNRGGGKANPYQTPVATPNGFVKMGDLKVGDKICTPYDGIQEVSAIYEQGKNTIYALHLDDGTEVQCMDNHRFWARYGTHEDFREYTAREVFDKYKIGKEYPFSLKQTETFIEIPLPGEVMMRENVKGYDLPIDPFLLGYLSGTGYYDFEGNKVFIGNDHTIFRKLTALGFTIFKSACGYMIKGLSIENIRKITKQKGRSLARVPQEYLTASIKARWEYLQGVFYKQGFSKKKHPRMHVPNKLLLEDIAQLARSLGIWAKIYPVLDNPEQNGWWGIVFICPDDKEIYRKVCYQRRAHVNGSKATSPHDRNMLTKKVLWVQKKWDKQPCRCITVTGKHHLYLTNAYTINHNTFTLLMEPIYDVQQPHFNGIILRKNKGDFNNIIRESRKLYDRFGKYNKSKDDMAWYFDGGAELKFDIFDMPYQDFDDKYRGQQFSYIGVDEVTQMSFKMFKFLLTCNRNSSGMRSRFLGTCNPDPLSWLRTFIDWYIGKDGKPIPERNGVIRYCYMGGDSVDEIVWGNTKEEVYIQCKEEIDKRWSDKLEELGYDKKTFFVNSVTFIKAELEDNKKLLKSDKGYIAKLYNQDEETKARELDGNWNFMEMGEDIITMTHLKKCFESPQILDDGIRRATCDVAFTGGDNCVLWLWIGFHVADVYVCKMDSMSTCNAIRAKLNEWGVLEENLCYDLNGLGQTLKGYFKKAIPFNNVEAVKPQFKYVYDNVKSQCAYMFAQKIQQTEISFEPTILEKRFSGKGFDGKPLKDILLLERKCIKQDTTKLDKGWCLIKKEQMINIIRHSPDFIEGLMIRMYFSIGKREVKIPTWVNNF